MQSILDKERPPRSIMAFVAIRCTTIGFLMQRINLLAAFCLGNALHSLHSLHAVQIHCTYRVCAMQCNETDPSRVDLDVVADDLHLVGGDAARGGGRQGSAGGQAEDGAMPGTD